MVFCMVKIKGGRVFGYAETLHTTSERVQIEKPAEGHGLASRQLEVQEKNVH